MLRFGFFEDFKGSDTLLIWGDMTGLSHLRESLRDLGAGKDVCISLHEMEYASSSQNLAVDFETSIETPVLRMEYDAGGGTILARCSAARFSEFAQKVAALVDPDCKTGHQYLDEPGWANVQIMVSKGEYPPDFGKAP